MPSANYAFTAFSAGEWSPLMEGRIDLQDYRHSCRSLLNVIPLSQGPATKRPGTKHVGLFNSGANPLSQANRIIPIRAQSDAPLALALGDDDAVVYDAGTLTANAELSSPAGTLFDFADIKDVQYSSFQSDVYMAHGSYHPKAAELEDDLWEIGDFSITRPPLRPENLESGVVISASKAIGDDIILTASGGTPFKAGHAGSYWAFHVPPDINNPLWIEAESITAGDLRYYASGVRLGAFNLYRAVNSAAAGTLPPVHDSGRAYDSTDTSGVQWDFVHSDYTYLRVISVDVGAQTMLCNLIRDLNITVGEGEGELPPQVLSISAAAAAGNITGNGTIEIKSNPWSPWVAVPSSGNVTIDGDSYAYTSFSGTTFTLSGTLTADYAEDAVVGIPAIDESTDRWTESAWSDVHGWPKAVAYGLGRVWFGGTETQPNTVFASSTIDSTDFEPISTTDTAGFSFTVTSAGGMSIKWMDYDSALIIGSTAGIHSVTGSSGGPVLPSDISPTHDTKIPVGNIRPIKAAGDTIYVNEARTRIYRLSIGGDDTRYSTNDITLRCEHLFRESPIVELAASSEGDQLVWALREDGTVVTIVYLPDDGIIGAAVQSFPYAVKSLSPFFQDDHYELSIIGVYDTEPALLTMDLTDDRVFLDGAVEDATTGLDHYEGESIQVIWDDATHPDVVVSSGAVTLDGTADSYSVAGKAYTSRVSTHLPETGDGGASSARVTSLADIFLRLYRTGPGIFYGQTTGSLDEYHLRNTNDNMDEGVPFLTGDAERQRYPGSMGRGELVIEHSTGLPFTLVAVFAKVVTND